MRPLSIVSPPPSPAGGVRGVLPPALRQLRVKTLYYVVYRPSLELWLFCPSVNRCPTVRHGDTVSLKC